MRYLRQTVVVTVVTIIALFFLVTITMILTPTITSVPIISVSKLPPTATLTAIPSTVTPVGGQGDETAIPEPTNVILPTPTPFPTYTPIPASQTRNFSESIKNIGVILAAIITPITALAGFISTALLNWREENRKRKRYELGVESERFTLEREKLQIEIERQKVALEKEKMELAAQQRQEPETNLSDEENT